ncbi:MAG: helix-turn-helix domain-containing protein [Candidatus Omnitrophica bacterium]|nr:helix-turn-helix domain-containing protein [Candidatus Omnitrophota bacterium]
MSDYVMTVKDTALYLRLSEMTILRLAQQGIIPGAKIGRQWRFAKESILELVKHPEIVRRMELRR